MHPDLFDETLDKKIYRMEKWILRLHRELLFLKEVQALRQRSHLIQPRPKKIQQLTLFGS